MRFTHIYVNFDVKYEGHQNCPKILSMNILRVFSDHHLWRQNWHQYLWTSLCQLIFFVNLLHSLHVWLFDIWHLFDNLTSFWQCDILSTFWHITWTISTHHWLGVKVGSREPISLYPLPMWPICPVPQYPCTILPHMPIPLYPILPIPQCPMCPTPPVPIAHVSCTPYPCTLLPHMPLLPVPLYPIPPVPYCPRWPIPLVPITHVAHTPYHLCPHYPCGLYPLYPIPLLCYCPMCPITPVPHCAMGHMGNEGNGYRRYGSHG